MNQIDRLLTIMQRLRDPENGCPWDKEQTFATIAPYTLEETYEVLDAIAREDPDFNSALAKRRDNESLWHRSCSGILLSRPGYSIVFST